jgi:hypothetical protein
MPQWRMSVVTLTVMEDAHSLTHKERTHGAGGGVQGAWLVPSFVWSGLSFPAWSERLRL